MPKLINNGRGISNMVKYVNGKYTISCNMCTKSYSTIRNYTKLIERKLHDHKANIHNYLDDDVNYHLCNEIGCTNYAGKDVVKYGQINV